MLNFRFERIQQLTSLSENSYIKIVVIVGDQNFATLVDADAWFDEGGKRLAIELSNTKRKIYTKPTDRVVCQAFAANLTQELAFVGEHLHAMRAIVRDEDLLVIVHHDAIWKFCGREEDKKSQLFVTGT